MHALTVAAKLAHLVRPVGTVRSPNVSDPSESHETVIETPEMIVTAVIAIEIATVTVIVIESALSLVTATAAISVTGSIVTLVRSAPRAQCK
jgi:hypothetical protein